MSYAKMLRTLFQGVTLNVEDLFFLESFQIKYLADRVPKPNAWAIHLFKDADVEAGKKIHDSLTLKWKYECTEYQDTTGWKLK